MSARYEMAYAADCPIEFVGSGEWIGHDQVEEGNVAIVLGDPWSSAFAVVGSREDICNFAVEILHTLTDAS